jgi:UDP-N-acetylglucosamine--N-acetylmuramyl-(pentapeptide) pyrophosphoryl-undecaprenol N-acetylglucosamine transferase
MKTNHPLKRVLIMAGGTGGHVFPGLALAAYLRDQGVEVHWLGTQLGIEARLVPEAGFPLHVISIGGVRGKGIKTLLTAPVKLIKAIFEARKIIKNIDPQIVIGMGGFASGPGGIASFLTRRPLIIHEQNAKAGLTNKGLGWFAKVILEGFPSAFKPSSRVRMIGNPVRREIENIAAPADRSQTGDDRLHVLVLGGSLGAAALNQMVPKALALIPRERRPVVRHQAGDKHLDDAKKHYESCGIDVTLQPFIKDMAEAYRWADIVICRAGALTVAELCAAGLPAVLVPYPFAVDDHQTANAQFMVKAGAAQLIQQSELTESKLAVIVEEFIASKSKRLAMANAAYGLRKVKVVETIHQICEEILA